MKLKLLLCLLASLSLSGCALQKDYVALQGRITLLEEELTKSQSLSEDVKGDITKKSARLENRFEGIEEEILTLRGTVEESMYLSKGQDSEKAEAIRAMSELRDAMDALSKKITRLELFTGYEPTVANGKPGAAPSSTDAPATADSIYAEAKKAFDTGDMESARRGFANVVKNFSTSDSSDNAQFWIGEIYYREKWYQKAILEYQKVIENYPDGNKVPAAYLKQGLAFEALSEKDNAQLILGELIRKYPDTAEANIARKKLGQ